MLPNHMHSNVLCPCKNELINLKKNSYQSPKFIDSISILQLTYIFHKTQELPFTYKDRIWTYQALEKP